MNAWSMPWSSMTTWLSVAQWLLAIAVTSGMAVWLATAVCAFAFRARRKPRSGPAAGLPPITLLKPVYGVEKNLRENLRTACLQDYPEYQVVFSVQRRDDPAIPILRELEREFGPELVTVVVESVEVGLNGKINNLCGAFPHARHDVLVISDSDVHLGPDFLARMVEPLADPSVGAVTTFFRARGAERWYEKFELLTLNGDQFPMAIFASATRITEFCFGASTAITRRTLERIGGFEAFGHSLVEDTEMGRRIQELGQRLVAIPYVVDTTVDLRSPADWVRKQIYWDQNTIAAVPGVYAASLCLRVIPLALLYAALRGGDTIGLAFFATALGVRLVTVATVFSVALGDTEGLRALWLVPIKDVLGIVWVVRAIFARTVVWRGVELSIGAGGRLSASPSSAAAVVEHGS
jgi:ceramide glucosyltransferase